MTFAILYCRWERNKGFWWDADEDIPTQVDDRIIGTSLAGLKGNRCFLVNTTGGNLVAEDCRKNNYYICEQSKLKNVASKDFTP